MFRWSENACFSINGHIKCCLSPVRLHNPIWQEEFASEDRIRCAVGNPMGAATTMSGLLPLPEVVLPPRTRGPST